MPQSKLPPKHLAAALELVRRLDTLAGGKLCCTECDVSVTQLLLSHMCEAHNLRLSPDVAPPPRARKKRGASDARVRPESRNEVEDDACMHDKKTGCPGKEEAHMAKPLRTCLEDLLKVDVKDKAAAVRVVDEISALLPEVSLESRLELQHADEPMTKCPEDSVIQALSAVEKFCDDAEATFMEAPVDGTFVALPDDEGDGMFRPTGEQDASEWVDFVECLRDSNEEPFPKVTDRLVELKEKYVCPVCDWKLPKRSLLFRHMQKHWDVGLKFCEECGKLSEIASVNTNCVDCLTKERVALKEARKAELENKCKIVKPEPAKRKVNLRHKCDGCGQKFATKTSAKVHDDYHDGGPCFECTPCHMAFASEKELVKHVKIRKCDGGQPIGTPMYKCSLCDRTFNKRANYLRHVDIHNGIRYCCKYCSRSYTQEYQLRCHESKHTGKPRFRCPVCDKAFIEPSTFSRHKKMHKRLSAAAKLSDQRFSDPEFLEPLSKTDVLADTDGDPLVVDEDLDEAEIKPEVEPNSLSLIESRRLPGQGTASRGSDSRPLRRIASAPPEDEDSADSVEVTLCRSIPAGRGKPSTLVANSYKAQPDGTDGYHALESQVIFETADGQRVVGRVEGEDEFETILGAEGSSSSDGLQAVQIEYNGKLYPAYII